MKKIILTLMVLITFSHSYIGIMSGGYESGGGTLSTSGKTSHLNEGLFLYSGLGIPLYSDFLELRFGLMGTNLHINWTNSGMDTYFVDALLMINLTDFFHFGMGVRYDIFSQLDPYGELPSQSIDSNLGVVYTVEFTPDIEVGEGILYIGIKYTEIEYTNPATSETADGNTFGVYGGVYVTFDEFK